ncbi:hypothetical protein U1Q18_009288 [Sarracenia purpurea var. burkii]
MPRSRKRLSPAVKAWPLVGGLIRFLKVMLREEYPKLGSVFTLNLMNKNITFFIEPEVSAHFFKASKSDLCLLNRRSIRRLHTVRIRSQKNERNHHGGRFLLCVYQHIVFFSSFAATTNFSSSFDIL